jgi:hypothetical protein
VTEKEGTYGCSQRSHNDATKEEMGMSISGPQEMTLA